MKFKIFLFILSTLFTFHVHTALFYVEGGDNESDDTNLTMLKSADPRTEPCKDFRFPFESGDASTSPRPKSPKSSPTSVPNTSNLSCNNSSIGKSSSATIEPKTPLKKGTNHAHIACHTMLHVAKNSHFSGLQS